MEVEDEFGVKIDDETAGSIATVGELAACVSMLLRGEAPPRPPSLGLCQSALTFYRMRRHALAHLPVNRCRVTPKTPLDQIVLPHQRRRYWEQLNQSGFYVPPLQSSLQPLIFVAVGGGTIIGLWIGFRLGALIAIGAVVAFVIGILWLMNQARTVPPPDCRTFGDLVRQSLPPLESLGENLTSDDRVFEKVRQVVADQTGILPAKIGHGTHFVRDLGF